MENHLGTTDSRQFVTADSFDYINNYCALFRNFLFILKLYCYLLLLNRGIDNSLIALAYTLLFDWYRISMI